MYKKNSKLHSKRHIEANDHKALKTHMTAQFDILVEDSLLEGAVLPGGHDADADETDATWPAHQLTVHVLMLVLAHVCLRLIEEFQAGLLGFIGIKDFCCVLMMNK